MLSDTAIRKYLESGDIVIDPLEHPEKQIQPASVDLYLGNQIMVPAAKESYPTLSQETLPSNRKGDKLWRWERERINLFDDGYRIDPGEFIIGTTKEWVSIDESLAARLDGRSSIGRLGITVHAAAGFIDPGFAGQVTLEIQNTSHTPVYLHNDRRVCQMYFFELDEKPQQSYKTKGGKYMNQEGPVQSLINQDTEG